MVPWRGSLLRVSVTGSLAPLPCLPTTSAAPVQRQTLRVILKRMGTSVIESVKLEKPVKIIESNREPNTAKSTNALSKEKIPPCFIILPGGEKQKKSKSVSAWEGA